MFPFKNLVALILQHYVEKELPPGEPQLELIQAGRMTGKRKAKLVSVLKAKTAMSSSLSSCNLTTKRNCMTTGKNILNIGSAFALFGDR